jgi:hypothetical protein
MINGGLGLQLAGDTVAGEKAYGVIAGLVWVAYVATVITTELNPKKPPAKDIREDSTATD